MSPLPKRQVYVLRSIREPKRHYVGLTSNINTRLLAHSAGLSKHTSKFSPWDLRVCVEFADQTAAAAFEQFLKSGSGPAFAKRHFG